MDSGERATLIAALRKEAVQSLREALAASARWKKRSAELSAIHRHSPSQTRLAKRDDLEMKDSLSIYTWHRDNSNWADAMIRMLMSEETDARHIPAQR